jgi:hypothetical protein
MYIFFFSSWCETEANWYCGHIWPVVPASDDRWWWVCSSRWDENWQRKPKYWEKTCPSTTLSTTNPTWPDLGSNPGRRGGKPAITAWAMPRLYTGRLISLWFYKENKLRDWKNVFTYSSLSSTHLWLVFLTAAHGVYIYLNKLLTEAYDIIQVVLQLG